MPAIDSAGSHSVEVLIVRRTDGKEGSHTLHAMKMERKLILVAAFLGLLGSARSGFLNGDCELKHPDGKEVDYYEWIYDLFLHPAVVDTSPPGTEIARFASRNIVSITGRQSKYIRVQLANGYLTLTLNEDFIHFEERETEPDLKLNLDFQCRDGEARIAMWGLVEDTNNHAPTFEGSPPYRYSLPLPYPPGVPLSCVTGVVVAAVDMDLSTTRINFEIRGTDALQVSGTWKVGRSFHANVTTTRYITAPVLATLRATDDGVPPQSTETALTVTADVARSLHTAPPLIAIDPPAPVPPALS